MRYKVLSFVAALAILLSAAGAIAGNASTESDKPITHISNVNNAADDSVVYLQGYITQNLGNEMYMFQDSSGTMAIEIDDDLLDGAKASPTTLVWIAAEVDKDGDVVSLEADEIQFLPENNTAANMQ